VDSTKAESSSWVLGLASISFARFDRSNWLLESMSPGFGFGWQPLGGSATRQRCTDQVPACNLDWDGFGNVPYGVTNSWLQVKDMRGRGKDPLWFLRVCQLGGQLHNRFLGMLLVRCWTLPSSPRRCPSKSQVPTYVPILSTGIVWPLRCLKLPLFYMNCHHRRTTGPSHVLDGQMVASDFDSKPQIT